MLFRRKNTYGEESLLEKPIRLAIDKYMLNNWSENNLDFQ